MSVGDTRSILVCYDIADPKRLRRVAKMVEAAGLRVQRSVFECSLNTDQWRALRQRLGHVIDPGQDRLLYQCLCPRCREQTLWQGLHSGPEFAPYWVV